LSLAALLVVARLSLLVEAAAELEVLKVRAQMVRAQMVRAQMVQELEAP